jgi:hypothetical protein
MVEAGEPLELAQENSVKSLLAQQTRPASQSVHCTNIPFIDSCRPSDTTKSSFACPLVRCFPDLSSPVQPLWLMQSLPFFFSSLRLFGPLFLPIPPVHSLFSLDRLLTLIRVIQGILFLSSHLFGSSPDRKFDDNCQQSNKAGVLRHPQDLRRPLNTVVNPGVQV